MSNFQKMNIMKKLLFLLLSVFTLQVAQADNDKPITFDKLPAKAQSFHQTELPHGKGGIHQNGERILGHEL